MDTHTGNFASLHHNQTCLSICLDVCGNMSILGTKVTRVRKGEIYFLAIQLLLTTLLNIPFIAGLPEISANGR